MVYVLENIDMSNESSKSRFTVAGGSVGEDARKAMNAAIDAFSGWRDDIAQQSEKNSKAVFDQMASAAKAFGWPAEFVDMTRQQMQNASRMQIQFMDQVMDVWEKQLKNPGSFEVPDVWTDAMKKLSSGQGFSFPGMSNFPGMPNVPGMQGTNFPGLGAMNGIPGNPFQFWMQAAEMWQKSWEQGMKAWMDAQSSLTGRK
jgi:hypothetical protein